jgi:hypothetical protein
VNWLTKSVKKVRIYLIVLLLVLSLLVLVSAVLPFLPWAVSIGSVGSFKEQLYPIYYQGFGFEEVLGDNVVGWSLINGSKISRTIVFEGKLCTKLDSLKAFL